MIPITHIMDVKEGKYYLEYNTNHGKSFMVTKCVKEISSLFRKTFRRVAQIDSIYTSCKGRWSVEPYRYYETHRDYERDSDNESDMNIRVNEIFELTEDEMYGFLAEQI